MNKVDTDRCVDFIGRKRGGYFFQVRPRFTPGSPAMVDMSTALRVAEEERAAYKHAIQGRYGDDKRALAERHGLYNVVELCVEEPRKKWRVLNLCNGEVFERPFEYKELET